MTPDAALLVQVVSLLGSAALVAWRFSAVATKLEDLTVQVQELVKDFKSERTERESQAKKIVALEVTSSEHGKKIERLEILVKQ